MFPFLIKRQCRSVQILTYHRVNDEGDPFFPAAPIDVFAKQMDYLAHTHYVCSLEEAVERLKRNDVPDNAVVVTLDDGYKDNYINAFPILKQLSIPATIFLATDAIGSERILWQDRVFSAFRETQLPLLSGFANNRRDFPLDTVKERVFAQNEVLKLLWSLDRYERLRWIDCLTEQLQVDDKKASSNLMLTWDEVRSMAQDGISFGSHTVTHPILSKLTAERVWDEISQSKRVIERQLGCMVRTLAYPRGKREDFNDGVKNMLKEAGYICGLTTMLGTNDESRDLFELRRYGPWGSSLPKFAMQLTWHTFVHDWSC
jgi:peptidoglycan/xylan/chitin deacetylase (PgdA/CDA1 family)